jgi:hypothetical protein
VVVVVMVMEWVQRFVAVVVAVSLALEKQRDLVPG